MTVATILAGKGKDVVTIQPHRTLGEVSALLAAHNIGVVIVSDGQGGVIGILSERDIVRAIGVKGAGALDDAASMHMTTKVVTTTEDEMVLSIVEKMNAGHFRHLPVIKDGKLDGLVSIGDAIKFRLAEMEHEHSAMREYIATA